MEKKSRLIYYSEIKTPNELEAWEQRLFEAAINIAQNAYAPYSNFKVGAAVQLSNGTIVKGANVENAAFPSGICAERNAIAAAVANHPSGKIEAIAIVAYINGSLTPEPVTPCGNCRQVIAEEEIKSGKEIKIILGGKNKIIIIEGIKNLLPFQFSGIESKEKHKK